MNPDAPRVLMISYWYPPTPGAGAQRAGGFAVHLPGFGWHTLVVAALGRGLHRPWVIKPVAMGWTEQPPNVLLVPDFWPADDALRPCTGPPRRNSLRDALRGLFFPDRFGVWRRRTIKAAGRMMRRHAPDAIWATFPPASAAIVGVQLARRFGRPLVLDLRDPWLGIGGHASATAHFQRRHQQLERNAVANARAIVVISDVMRDDVMRRHGLSPERIAVIPNGFDAEACSSERPPTGDRSPRLIHVGSVAHRNRPDLFLDALARFRREGRSLPCTVRFVGNLSPRYVARLALGDVVETTGLVPAPEARRQTLAAPALLLLVGDYVGTWGHNAKVFEYLRSGRPILCLEETPGSNDRRLLERIAPQRTVFARLTDPPDILRGVDEVMDLAKHIPFGQIDESPELMAYDRRRLAGELARVLDVVTGCR